MKTIYRSRKRVTREMTGSTHTLPILIEYAWSMARVWLEYGWRLQRHTLTAGQRMARAWLEIATPHSDHWSENAYTHRTEGQVLCTNEITAHFERDYGSFAMRLRLTLSLLLLLMVGTESVWGQAPVEITTAEDIANNTKKLYLIQTNAFPSFYIAPQSNNTITTNNIFGDYLLWYFLDAGKDNEGTENEIQYYYIVNNSTGKYIYNHNGNSRGINITNFASLSDANKEKCKFKLVVDNSDETIDFYNIDVKANQSYYGLNKQNGSQANDNPIRLTNDQYIHDSNSKWKFVPYNGTYSWPVPPFTPSTDSDKHFYKIHNVQNGTYYVSTDETPDKVTYASTTSDRMVWYLKEAGSDSWFKYYYIINPSTGDKYMYYNGTANDGNDQTNAVSVKAYDSNNEDRYQFVVVQAARGDGASRVECYAIIPKLLRETLWASNSIGPKTISDGANMGIITSRKAGSTAQWTFESTDFSTVCADPTITFSTATGKATISTTTAFSTIHYTTDGSTPSSTEGTEYADPFDVTEETTINAIVTKNGFTDSHVITTTIYQVATPTIQDNGSHAISITSETEDATIYYTIDGSDPNTSSTEYTAPLTDDVSGVTIKAIAVKDGMLNSTIASGTVTLSCANPVFTRSGNSLTINCSFPTSGVSIYYTKNGDEPTSSSTPYTGPISVAVGDVIKAVAIAEGYNSSVATKTIYADLTPVDGKCFINSQIDFEIFLDMANTTEGATQHFILKTNVDAGSSISEPFTGVFEVDADANGNFYTISGLTHSLFNTVNGGTVKNVILESVSISSGTNVGAICGEATGDTRIYNCGVLGGSVGGSDKVGGIVGLLDGSSRVINCYNYANITSGSNCGGIVGYNNVESTSSNLQTMVMNCMFYGNITGGNAAPIYGGENIHNKYDSEDDTGLNNYCYFLYDEEKNPYVKEITADNYHGALGAEERYLNRFEFFRMTLNSTRNLAAFYATGDVTKKGEMAKWVLDKSIAPYPILKVQDTYPSIVNPDADHATTQTERNIGGKLGTLSIKIQLGSGGEHYNNTGATLNETSITRNITDKDFENFNFNYKKIQLPYYSEVGNGNYTNNRVVTGWKIVEINGSSTGTGDFVDSGTDAPAFNFVDRTCTNKDLYSVSGRVFAQGAYWEVPDGVTAITIEPYWAKAVYLSDANYDMTYTITITGSGSSATATASKYGVIVCGSCPTEYNGQTVYTNLSTAITNLASDASHKVYDYAVVLVGNYHQAHNNALVNNGKPITFMSADLDGDNEPDNTLFYYHNQRKVVSPIRFDFLNIPGIGMVKRTYDSSMDPEPGIFAPQGWFEITNTVFIRFGQFEYAGSNSATKTILAPLILQGGIYEQFVSCCRTNAQNTNYLLIGGNAWFKNFANGCHTAQANTTPKVPINVTGGDYTNFYLTGIYQPTAAEASENAECYIDGGRFVEVAGSGMQQVKGNVTWLINAADITSFYGGGINAAKPITGSISTTISNSYVDEFYGGPKFGDMSEEKTVTTNATDCHFGKFFGAGYGGTAFNRVGPVDSSDPADTRGWNGYVNTHYKRAYSEGNGGISTNYDYEFILHSDGSQTVARFFVDYASLSLASTRNVTNTLSGCTIGTFYGGGSLGAVNGDVTSTLTDCTVTGNAFGAGFSASVPTVEVWNSGAYLVPNPTYNRTANVFNNASVKTPKDNGQYVVYTWSKTHGTNTKPFVDEDGKHYIHTDVSLDGLGAVTGNVTLIIDGNIVADENGKLMSVGGNVYGGGEESGVNGTTNVNITGGTITGSVFGGGEAGIVKEAVAVNMTGGLIQQDVYGGGALADTQTSNWDVSANDWAAGKTSTSATTTVRLTGGTIAGNVYGGGLGEAGKPAYVWGDVLVDLNGTTPIDDTTHKPSTTGTATTNARGCVVGQVFGCNNVNGTPKGDVMVHVYATQNAGATQIANTTEVTDAKVKDRYDVTAVYGGGNQAAYNPVTPYKPTEAPTGSKTQVIIEGCDKTSIETVYGGGNAAAVPETNVEVRGTYEIGYVFGGGNGKDDIAPGVPNPGADVGTLDQGTTTYGTGNANTLLKGGLIREAYGGSNTKGIIKGSINQITDPEDPGTPGCCELVVEKIVGAGKYADIDGDVNMTLSCQPNKKVDLLFAGADEANVNGNITLNITNGYFGKVFGGNNLGGAIKGKITVNVEETGCQPIKIDNLYLGSNEAAYSVFGYYISDEDHPVTGKKILKPRESATDARKPVKYDGTEYASISDFTNYAQPELNIISCTYIGNVFGGGLGEGGKMYANPTVNINMEPGLYANDETVGVPKVMTELGLNASENPNNLGIIRNIYGGGDQANIEGNTTVNIATVDEKSAYIIGNVFGAGRGLETNYQAALVKGTSTVNMMAGLVKGNIYGGGELSSVGTFTFDTTDPSKIIACASGTGTATVTISGGTVGNSSEYTYDANNRLAHTNGGNVFAGCKGVLKKSDDSYLSDWIKFARVKNTVLTVSGGTIMSSIYGGGEIGSVGFGSDYGNSKATDVTVSGGIIGTEIKDNNNATQYTFGSVFGGGYGSDLETTIEGETDPNAPKLYAGRVYGNTSVAMSNGAVKASVYGGGELASVNGNATVTVSGGSVGIPKDGDKQFGGATMGNVYGGGSGNKNIVRAGQIFGNTNVSISETDPINKPTRIYHNIYGGGAYGSVGTFEYHYTKEAEGYEGIDKVDGITSCAANTGTATVTVTGGTIGADGKENGMIFGSSRGDVGAPGSRDDLVAWVNTTNVTIGDASSSAEDLGPTIKGSVYGSGENGHTLGNAVVTVEKGTIGIHDETAADGTRGNVYGAGCGTDKYYEDPDEETYDGNGQLYNPKAGIVQGTATVTINGGHILHNVYGAGAMGPVGIDGEGHKTTVNINGGRIGYDGNDNGYVFGGARGDQGIGRNFAYVGDTEVNINYTSTPDADNNEKTEKLILGSVFGGGEAGSVHGAVVVNMTKGLVVNDVYGGGALADTNTDNWGTDTWAAGKTAASNTTTVNLIGGKVIRNVYGGGLGQTEDTASGQENIEAKVYGNVLVELNNGVADDAKGCVVLGSIFGCNNLNGTPMGDVKVHIYKTQNNAASCIANQPAGDETPAVEDAKVLDRYDVAAVYGGGNQSAYVPADLTGVNKTEVIIDGCGLTSIQQVYGGGNAACTPATNVTVNGTFEIDELFGGGNGLDNILINGVEMPNPGANVGYKNYSEYYQEGTTWKVRDLAVYDTKEERMAPTSALIYGTGKASVNIYGGTVHHVFGGSNTKGNVRLTAVTLLDEEGECEFCVDEAYGGGKSAEMDAEAQLLMACIPGLQAVYGGAEAADVRGNVTLNITNGTFDRVFGGNNLSGTIGGSITVNVEEIGCKPVKIGELYGGGNQAGYSVYGYDAQGKPKETGDRLYDDPQVNVMSFTSIGNIYGGGFGDGATLVGNPTVNVNVANGRYYNDDVSIVGENAETPNHYPIPSHAKGKMGAISNVFGGGNAAKVIGNTNVNIGTLEEVYVVKQVKVGADVSNLYTRSGAGTTASPFVYTATDATDVAVDGTTYYEKKNVLGVDIRGNVYGGGNNAEVTGDSKVKIGKKNE